MSVAARLSTSRDYFKGWRLGCLGVAAGFWTIVAAIVGGCSILLIAGSGPFDRAPALPSWAYPEGDVLHRYSSCGGNSDDLPPCRNVVLGTNSTLTMIEAELEPEFSRRGWHTERGPGEWFSARSPANDVCISYFAFYREQAISNAKRYGGGIAGLDELWSRFSARVDAYVDDCSFKG